MTVHRDEWARRKNGFESLELILGAHDKRERKVPSRTSKLRESGADSFKRDRT